jgi:hypothetical protein
MSVAGPLVLLGLGVFAVLVGGGVYLAMRKWPQGQSVDDALSQAGLTVEADTRSELDKQAARRAKGTAIGGGLGAAAAIVSPAALHDLAGAGSLMIPPILALAGMHLGSAFSARASFDLEPGKPRVTALQPHGLTEYLSMRELIAEVVLSAVGVLSLAVGAMLVVGGGSTATAGWVAAVLGLTVGGVAVAALVVQYRMLNAPMHASSTAHVVANDVVLSWGVRDTVAAVAVTAGLGAYSWLVWLDPPLPWIVAGLGAILGGMYLVFDYSGVGRAPVARRLTAGKGPL